MVTKNVKPVFLIALAFVSIVGFLVIALNSFTQIDIGIIAEGLIFTILGIGLVMEGNIRGFIKYSRDGLQGDEVSHASAVVIGLMSIIAGILTFFNIISLVLDSFKGIVAIIAIVIIIVETFLVK